MNDRQEFLSSAQQQLKQLILDNPEKREEDRFLVDNYKPEKSNLPRSWGDFQTKGDFVNTLHLLPGSTIENIVITIREIKELFQAAQSEIEQVLKDKEVVALNLTDEAKKKITNDYMFKAKQNLVFKLANTDQIKSLDTIYGNQCKRPEDSQTDEQIAHKIKFGALEKELKNELFAYVAKRSSESESYKFTWFCCFFNPETNFNKKDKVGAATKLKQLLEGKHINAFTPKELSAFKDGRLGKILTKYKKLGLPVDDILEEKSKTVAELKV